LPPEGGTTNFFIFRSFQQQKRTGTTNMVMVSLAMPLTVGMAMGIMMSVPRPVAVDTDGRARKVVPVVIKQGAWRS